MANFKALDKDSNPIEFAAEGTGTSSAPFVPHHKVVASALPDNAATATNQETIFSLLGAKNEPEAISDSATSGLNGLLKRLLQKVEGLLQKLVTTASGIKVDGSAVIQPVSGTVSVSGAISINNFPSVQGVVGTVEVANFPTTQPVSGTVGINNFPATQPISATALPLPSGAATEVTLGQVRDRLPQQRLSYQNLGTSSAGVVKNSAGVISAIACYNKSNAVRWIQLYNKTTVPSGSDTPIENHPIFAGSYLVLDSAYFGQLGLAFGNGISFGFSSTSGTFTSATATDLELHLKYL